MNLPEWISAIAACAALVVSGIGAILHWKLRAERAEFYNDLLIRLDSRYLRKPEHEDDYPVTRREFNLAIGKGVHRP